LATRTFQINIKIQKLIVIFSLILVLAAVSLTAFAFISGKSTLFVIAQSNSTSNFNETMSVSDQLTAGIAPRITSVVAAGTGANDISFASGDTITIHFSQPTNEKFADSQNGVTASQITTMFSCSSSLSNSCTTNLGTDFIGKWEDPSTLTITAGTGGGAVAVSNNLIFTPIANSGLTNAAGTASVSTTSPVMTGDFLGPQVPYIKSFVVYDPNSGAVTFHAGDTFSVVFSEPTNEPGGTGTLDQSTINSIFSFLPSLGSATYTGKWTNPSLFNITMNTVDGANPAIIGTTTIQAIGTGTDSIKNSAGTSSASSSKSPPLSGSFGTFSVSLTVASGGTAVTTLPSGITAQVTLPSSSSGTVTIAKTTASTSGSGGSTLQFLGGSTDISVPSEACSASALCTFSFEFTRDDLNNASPQISDPSQVKIFHDQNNDGDFSQDGETLQTTVTTVSSGLFLAKAQDSHTSKFAIGGVVKVLAILGASENNAASPPTFSGVGFSSDEYPLTINGKGFKLVNYTNSVETETFEVGKPVTLSLLAYENAGPFDIQGVSLFTNLHGADLEVASSNTVLAYQNDSPTISDPDGFFKSVNINTGIQNYKLETDFNITFAKPMQTTNLIIRAWDKHGYVQDVTVLHAFQVAGPSSLQSKNSTFSKPSIDTISSVYIPSWIKNNAGWWHDGKINDSNFIVGIQYLVDNKIIKLPRTDPNLVNSQQIPPWVKANAGWWADGQIPDDEFVKGLQFLINQGIIRV
jgi:hypothetical protein